MPTPYDIQQVLFSSNQHSNGNIDSSKNNFLAACLNALYSKECSLYSVHAISIVINFLYFEINIGHVEAMRFLDSLQILIGTFSDTLLSEFIVSRKHILSILSKKLVFKGSDRIFKLSSEAFDLLCPKSEIRSFEMVVNNKRLSPTNVLKNAEQ